MRGSVVFTSKAFFTLVVEEEYVPIIEDLFAGFIDCFPVCVWELSDNLPYNHQESLRELYVNFRIVSNSFSSNADMERTFRLFCSMHHILNRADIFFHSDILIDEEQEDTQNMPECESGPLLN